MELRGEVAQGQVELGGEDENGERRLEADAALDEANADRDCGEQDPERRPEPLRQRFAESQAEGLLLRTLSATEDTPAAEPPLEPPGVRAGSHGLRVMPCNGLLVKPTVPCSDAVVRPVCDHRTGGRSPTTRFAPVASRNTWY